MLSSNWSSSLLFFTFMRLPPDVKITNTPLRVSSSLSVMTQAEPNLFYPKKISTQTRGETNFIFLSPAHSKQDLKSVQQGIFFKNSKKMWVRTLPFQAPKFPFSSFLLYLNNVLISNCEVHWWLSDQRVRHETVWMRRIRMKENKMSSKFVLLKWE